MSALALAKADREYLSPIQLGRLLPLIPPILSLLREHTPMAADRFLEGEIVERKAVNFLMSDLLNTLNFNGDFSMMELRFSFASYKFSVWLGLVREVLTGCWPRIVPDRVASSLLGSLSYLNEAQSPADCSALLGPYLDRIPRTRFRVLAEFCAFLRDTTSSQEDLACLTGPFLLCPSNTLTTEGTSVLASQTAASAAIMDMLISECELLFGRYAAPVPRHPLGKRPAQTKGQHRRGSVRKSIRRRVSFGRTGGLGGASVNSGHSGRSGHSGSSGGSGPPALPQRPARGDRRAPPPPPPRMRQAAAKASDKHKMTITDKRKLGLRVFYQWRDPRRVDRVEILFANYEFEEIALAIQRKYFGLPPGWAEQLDYMLLTGNRNLGWFARLKQGVLPAPVEEEISAIGGHHQQAETKIDKVINEIADTEITFNRTLVDLMEHYVLRIKNIAEGNLGAGAAKALGLTAEQVEHCFGTRLAKVVEVSNTLVSDLEVITLVRVQPKTGKSRIELVSRIFMEISDQLRVFGPFACGHKTAVTFLRQGREHLNDANRGGGLRRLGGLLGDSKKSFDDIWKEVSVQHESLNNQTLESILIMPVQRVPRYKLLMEQLLKSTPEDDPNYIQLAEVCDVIRGLATDINEAIRAHDRLMRRFGEDVVVPTR